MTLPSPKQLLETYGLKPKHSFGQNFLSDVHLTSKIARLASPEKAAAVLEIGSGLGALTDELLARDHRVLAVERDRDLVPVLREVFKDRIASGQLTVLEEDAKALDWQKSFESLCQVPGKEPLPRVLAGNLPYQITGPLIEKTVHMGREIERAVFLVQKEVADRLAASPGTKTYGALSVFVQAQFLVERAFVIKAGAFYPQPRVDSAVICLRPHPTAISEETWAFRKVVKAAFAARRKTLRNAWKSLAPSELLTTFAAASGVNLDDRGETLTVHQFAKMASLIEAEGTEKP